MFDKLNYLKELLKLCFLPELKNDFDSMPIENEHFVEYREFLKDQLPFLFDFIQQHKEWLFENDDTQILEVRACLVVLLCEVAAIETLYKLFSEDLLKNLNRILLEYCRLEEPVENNIFIYYQSKLNYNACWKRHLGSVHSFAKFLEYRQKGKTSRELSSKFLEFSLSVALNLRECYGALYKQIGTRICETILRQAAYEDVINLNIHSVVYDAVFKDIYIVESEIVINTTWDCLYKCLDFFPDIDSLNWSYVDDMVESMIRVIPLAPNSMIAVGLMKYVTKLGYYFTINVKEMEFISEVDLSILSNVEICRNKCSENTSYTPFRWAKSVLNLFAVESYRLLQSPKTCRQLLKEIHRCYMVYILPIALEIIGPHLCAFFDKFTAMLMKVITLHKEEELLKLLHSFLETFYLQLERLPSNSKCRGLFKYREAYKILLQNKIHM